MFLTSREATLLARCQSIWTTIPIIKNFNLTNYASYTELVRIVKIIFRFRRPESRLSLTSLLLLKEGSGTKIELNIFVNTEKILCSELIVVTVGC